TPPPVREPRLPPSPAPDGDAGRGTLPPAQRPQGCSGISRASPTPPPRGLPIVRRVSHERPICLAPAFRYGGGRAAGQEDRGELRRQTPVPTRWRAVAQ